MFSDLHGRFIVLTLLFGKTSDGCSANSWCIEDVFRREKGPPLVNKANNVFLPFLPDTRNDTLPLFPHPVASRTVPEGALAKEVIENNNIFCYMMNHD